MAVCVTMDWISFSNFFTDVPLSQHTACTHTAMYCKYYCPLLGYWSSGMFHWLAGLKPSKPLTNEIKVLREPQISQLLLFKFNQVKWQRRSQCLHSYNERESWNTIYISYSLCFNTFKTILIVQLMHLNFSYWKQILNVFTYRHMTVHVTVFEKQWITTTLMMQ